MRPLPVAFVAMLALASAAAGSLSCASVTYSREAAVDFDRYRSVSVSVSVVGEDVDHSEYFAGELRRGSGFSQVTTNSGVPVDLVITVSVTVVQTSVDDAGTPTFRASAEYVAKAGVDTVDSGSESDHSSTKGEAIEDALDEVALHYLAPYRI